MERMLRAAENLLRERPFEEVTVAEIVRRAGTSVGAFYGRFSSKRDLLAALYARRFGGEASERTERYLAHFAAREMTLESRAREVVRSMMAYQRNNRQLLGALNPGPGAGAEVSSFVDRAVRAHQAAFHDGWARAFLRHSDQIGHPEPERAVRFALFLAAAACREAVLSGEPSGQGPASEELAGEISRAVCAYLAGGGSR